MTHDELYRFIARHKLAVVSTVSAEGTPQSALVGIAVTEKVELIFDTLRSTRKSRNIEVNPHVSFVIGTTTEVSVQYEGEAFVPEGAALEEYQRVYFAQFPDGPERLTWPGIVYYVTRPRWIRYSDYEARPARIEEIRFG
jgi:general stress protein 26